MMVIVDTYYPAFLDSLLTEPPSTTGYEQRLKWVMSHRFGTSDAYSINLTNLGWRCQEIIANSSDLQSLWARENGERLLPFLDRVPPSYISRIPLAGSLWGYLPTLQRILARQIDAFEPQIVYFQDLNIASDALLRKLRKDGKFIVGQIASPLPPRARLRRYDLILSSLPNQVEQIRELGIDSEFLPIAFDQRVLNELTDVDSNEIPLSFVGGISSVHGKTIPLLDAVVRTCPELEIYGYGVESLVGNANLLSRHRGERWGLEMYKTLKKSNVTLNRHIDIAGDFANNMRLFEATGVGSLLITDNKSNLSDYFLPGQEVLVYDSPDDAADVARWALDNVSIASKIAQAGQERTLTEHTYDRCMTRLVNLLEGYI